MAFIVETGEVVENANAYISVEEFRQWHVDRGVTAAGVDTGAYGEALIQAAIVKATDYVDKRFGPIFKGYKKYKDQSLEWPRLDVFDMSDYWIDSNTLPVYLKRAICEYAMIALKLIVLLPIPAPNFNAVNPDTGEVTVSEGGMLMRRADKVGPIEEERWYNQEQWRLELQGRAAGVVSSMVSTINLPEYPVADEWLKQIVRVGRPTRLVRA